MSPDQKVGMYDQYIEEKKVAVHFFNAGLGKELMEAVEQAAFSELMSVPFWHWRRIAAARQSYAVARNFRQAILKIIANGETAERAVRLLNKG